VSPRQPDRVGIHDGRLALDELDHDPRPVREEGRPFEEVLEPEAEWFLRRVGDGLPALRDLLGEEGGVDVLRVFGDHDLASKRLHELVDRLEDCCEELVVAAEFLNKNCVHGRVLVIGTSLKMFV